jgi:hypothetical protein
MAAGLGFKTFTTGEVLTAADTNGYLMQGVNVFANAAARTAAITSPQEGQMSYLKDTNSTEYYSGSAWVAVGGSGGMTLLSTTTLSGATVTISSISQSYKRLVAYIYGVTNATAAGTFQLRPNGSTTISTWTGVEMSGAAVSTTQGLQLGNINLNTPNSSPVRTDANNAWTVTIDNYASTTNYKPFNYYGIMLPSVGTSGAVNFSGGIATNSAISSLVFANTGGDLSTGTVLLYGVN